MSNLSKKLRTGLGVLLFIGVGILAIILIGLISGIPDIMNRDTGETIIFCILVVFPVSIAAYYFFRQSRFPISEKRDTEAALLKEKAFNEIRRKHTP